MRSRTRDFTNLDPFPQPIFSFETGYSRDFPGAKKEGMRRDHAFCIGSKVRLREIGALRDPPNRLFG